MPNQQSPNQKPSSAYNTLMEMLKEVELAYNLSPGLTSDEEEEFLQKCKEIFNRKKS
jgi:DnaJ-domain-containing protein 1